MNVLLSETAGYANVTLVGLNYIFGILENKKHIHDFCCNLKLWGFMCITGASLEGEVGEIVSLS